MSKDTDDQQLGVSSVSKRILDANQEIVRRVWGETPKAYCHSVLCSVGLPYRNPGDDVRSFQRISGAASLRLEAGAVPTADGSFRDIGLPYGPRSRLLLLHLCSEAVKQQTPILEVEDSFTAFARALGLSINGRNLQTLRDQILRMSVVSMRLSKQHGNYVDVFQGPVFSKLRAEMPSDPDQLTLWTSYVEFSHEFYNSLKENAVPMRMEAISALKHSARALDIYAWLSHRLHRVKDPLRIRWTSLRYQFGNKDQDIKSFKRAFSTALRQVLAVYPEARVSSVSGGIQLRQSPPPVPFRKAVQGKSGLLRS